MGAFLSGPSVADSCNSMSTAPLDSDVCGEIGSFVLNFDDVPPLAIGDQPFDSVQPQPLFNPYHHFIFSNGFTVVPPPTSPYLPSSKPLLLEFIPTFSLIRSDTVVGSQALSPSTSAGIGNNDHDRTGCFTFNVLSASFGCDSAGPKCDFFFTGYRYFEKSSSTLPFLSREVAHQRRSINACSSMKDCALTLIQFDPIFEDLDLFQINLTVAGQPKIWWMDDLSLGWFNKSYTCRQYRFQSHVH